MKKFNGMFITGALLAMLVMPFSLKAADPDLQQKVDQLSRELDTLKQQVKKNEDKSLGRWLEVSGDYRFRYDNLRGQVAPYADGLTLFGNVGTLMSAMGSGKIAPMTQPALFGAAINGGTFGTGASAFAIPTAKRDAFDVKNDALY